MPLSEQERATVEEARKLKITIEGTTDGLYSRAVVEYLSCKLLGVSGSLLMIIDRLAGEPEAEWVRTGDLDGNEWKCSHCGETLGLADGHTPEDCKLAYCNGCGYHMTARKEPDDG